MKSKLIVCLSLVLLYLGLAACNGCVWTWPPPAPVGVGGSVASGGASSGGTQATGGAPSIRFPGCEPSRVKRAGPEPERKFGPPTKPRTMARGASAEPEIVTGPSVWWQSNDCDPPNLGDRCVSLDQGPIGACTGFDAAQVSCTQPYTRTCTNADGLLCYSAATKLDNGCAYDAPKCPGAYPPNDVGSWASSAFDAATLLGWFSGTRPVLQTIQGWHDALLDGPCGFDQNWYADGFSTDTCGGMAITGKLAGGHSTMAVGFDTLDQKIWLRQSWGSGFGVHGGFFYYTVPQLHTLWLKGANMVCPKVPHG